LVEQSWQQSGEPQGRSAVVLEVAGGGWVFCAAAEDSRDSYGDGRCLGSVVGLVRDARVVAVERLDRLCKAEGISVREGTAGLDLLLVIDGDDRSIPALLLSATLSAN
jgi:hypothetical protein